MKKTFFNISIVCSFFWVNALFAEQPAGLQNSEEELQISSNAPITTIITNTFTQVKILLIGSARSMIRPDVVLERGRERKKLDIGEAFFLSDLLTATQTNIAYALIAKYQKSESGYRRSDEKLVSILLPTKNKPLDSYVINTIFNMDDLNTEKGRSWISDLKDISADGRRLLVEKSEPCKLSERTTIWEYKIMILDVPKKTFADLDWKSTIENSN